MPIAKVQLPDGRTATIEVPEGASESDILSFAQSIKAPTAPETPPASTATPTSTTPSKDELRKKILYGGRVNEAVVTGQVDRNKGSEVLPALESFARGTTKPILGAAQIALPSTSPVQEDIAYATKQIEEQAKQAGPGGEALGMVGQLGTELVGGGAAFKGLKGLGVLGKAGKVTQGSKLARYGKATAASSAGAGVGATASGALEPVTGDTAEERSAQRKENIKNAATLGFGIGAVGRGMLQPVLKGTKGLLERGGVLGSKKKQAALLEDLAGEFSDVVDTINVGKVNNGEEPIDIDALLQKLEQPNTTLGDLNLAADTIVNNPAFTYFLGSYRGAKLQPLNRKIQEDSLSQQLADAVGGVDFGDPETFRKFAKMQAEASKVEPTYSLGMTIPKGEASRGVVAKARAGLQKIENTKNNLYSEAFKNVADSPADGVNIAADVQELVARDRVNADLIANKIPSILKGDPAELETLTVSELNDLYQRVNKDTDSLYKAGETATADALAPIRDYLKNKRRNVLQTLSPESLAAFDKAEKFYKDEYLPAVGSYVPGAQSTSPEAKSAIISKLDEISRKREFDSTNALDKFKTRESVDEYLRLPNTSVQDIEGALDAKLDFMATDGKVDKATIAKFRKDNLDTLNNPALSPYSEKLLKIESALDTAKEVQLDNFISPATAAKFSDSTKVTNMLGNPDMVDEMISFAKKNGQEDAFKATVMDSIKQELISELPEQGKRLDYTGFAKKLVDQNKKYRASLDKIFGEDAKVLTEALNVLNTQAQNKALAKTAASARDSAAAAASTSLELFGISIGQLTPAQATRIGNLKDLIARQGYETLAAEIATNPELAKRFLKVAKGTTDREAIDLFSEAAIGALQGAGYAKTTSESQQGPVPTEAPKPRVLRFTVGAMPSSEPTVQTPPKPRELRLDVGGGDVVYEANPNDLTQPIREIKPGERPFDSRTGESIDVYDSGTPAPDKQSLLRGFSTGQSDTVVPSTIEDTIAPKLRPSINNELASIHQRQLMQYINDSANKAGLRPEVLKAILGVESNFRPTAKNPTSSAYGIGQITDSTWKRFVNAYGSEMGVSLNQRNNPKAQATVAAYIARDAKRTMQRLKENVDAADIYFAYFMGDGGARTIFKHLNDNIKAESVAPAAAKANRWAFYTDDGKPRTPKGVYNAVRQRFMEKANA